MRLRGGPRKGVGGAADSAALREQPLQRLHVKQSLEALCTFCLFFFLREKNVLRISFINKNRYQHGSFLTMNGVKQTFKKQETPVLHSPDSSDPKNTSFRHGSIRLGCLVL